MDAKGAGVANSVAEPDERPSAAQGAERSRAALLQVATARLKPIHALVLLERYVEHPPYHIALDRMILLWQTEWLQACGISVTLVTDDPDVAAFFGPGHSQSSASQVTVCGRMSAVAIIEQLMASRSIPVPLVAIMGGPFVTNCNLALAIQQYQRDHIVTTLVSDQATGRARLALVPAPLCAPVWYEFFAQQPAQSRHALTKVPGPVRCQRAHFWDYHEGRPDDQAALARAWTACPPSPAYRASRAGNGVYIHPTARIAPSAQLHGPVLIGTHATVEAHALVGPWTGIATAGFLDSHAWAERCALGPGVHLEARACVYASELVAGERVRGDAPILHARCTSVGGLPKPHAQQAIEREPAPGYLLVKRLLDVLIAAVALVALSPLLFLLGMVCLIDSGWPVLFIHDRLGHNGKLVTVYKFRTMDQSQTDMPQMEQVLADSPGYKLEGDPRITRLGRILRRTSLDELPQLVNILRGDLSLVGPRPIVQQEAERYGPYVARLLSVQPGLTGLWQVSGRSKTTYAQRVMLDVKYATEQSVARDLHILLRTVPAVVFQRGAQ